MAIAPHGSSPLTILKQARVEPASEAQLGHSAKEGLNLPIRISNRRSDHLLLRPGVIDLATENPQLGLRSSEILKQGTFIPKSNCSPCARDRKVVRTLLSEEHRDQ
jgi:hypothetical protein